ncbi:hypothetical protein BaRGS_00020296 [Batillaria attramentaria]|uniref:Vitellogenin domain-containing protein n=1 Tax=Batillaria attramentaria TaxID=370345 RepID=A0ABD0KNK5_9CAEN
MVLLNAYDIKKNEELHDIPPSQHHHSSLRMTLPQNSVESSKDNPYQLHFEEQQMIGIPLSVWSKDKMIKLVELVAQDTAAAPSVSGLFTMQTLMEMIQQSPFPTLKNLWESCKLKIHNKNVTTGPLMAKILFHMLSVAGTTPAVNVVLDECLENVSMIANCTSAVTMIGAFAPPSQATVYKLFKLARTPPQALNEKLAESSYLAAGSVMGRAVDRFEYMSEKGRKDILATDQVLQNENRGPLRKKLVSVKKELQNLVNVMASEHNALVSRFFECLKNIQRSEKQMNSELKVVPEDPQNESRANKLKWLMIELKTARNAHVPVAFSHLRSIVENSRMPPIIRISAIQAFDKFRTLHREASALIVLEMEKVLKNPFEIAAVRIQAFRTMLNVRAPQHVLVRVAGSLRYEKSRQVSCYVWSVLNKLGNSTFFPYRQLAGNLTMARSHASPVSCGIQDSTYYSMMHSPARKLSALAEMSYVQTPEFITQADLALNLDIFGASNKFLQMSWKSQSLQAVIKRLFGPKGTFTNQKSVFDLLKRKPRSTDTLGTIDDIWKKARHMPSLEAFVSLQLFNNDIRVWDLTDILQSILDQGSVSVKFDQHKWSAGKPFNYQTSGFAGHLHTALPTEAGLPVLINMGLAYSANVNGQVKAEVRPPLFEEDGIGKHRNVTVGVWVKPKVTVSIMGKMAVDCFVLQAGTAFNALIDINSPLAFNVSVNMKRSAAKVFFAPPTQNEPVLRMKLKPFFYSSTVPAPATARPIYKTMQPVMRGNGATIQQSSWCYGADTLGYNITMKGEHLWGAASSVSSPMLGRAHLAIYSTPGTFKPPGITASFKYLSEPRFRHGKKDACDGWFSFFTCFETDDPDDVGQPQPDDVTRPKPAPYPEYPDLYNEDISFVQLKHRLREKLGMEIVSLPTHAQYGIIAIVDTSTPEIPRKVKVEAAFKAFKDGQFHQGTVFVKRTPIPNYDPEPWQMFLTTEAMFPVRKITTQDLLSPKYQVKVLQDMEAMLKIQGHEVSSRYLNNTMATITSDFVMRLLPSLEPKIVIDRVVPEFVLMNSPYSILSIRNIMKDVLPDTKQIEEMREEMKDGIRIMVQKDLILSLARRIESSQLKVLKYLKDLSKKPSVQYGVVSSVHFSILKLSEGVLDLDEIMKRAIALHLVSEIKEFERLCREIMRNQLAIDREAYAVLPHLVIINPAGQAQAVEEPSIPTTPYTPPDVDEYGWSSTYNSDVYRQPPSLTSAEKQPARPINVRGLQVELKKLTTHQLKVIRMFQDALTTNQKLPVDMLPPLANDTAYNLTLIDAVFKIQQISDKIVIERLVQASCQHHLIVLLIRKALYGNMPNIVERQIREPLSVKSYTIKIQTKQLTERMSLALWDVKEDVTAIPTLDSFEQQIWRRLQRVERHLVTLQKAYITLPNISWPYTTSVQDLERAAGTISKQLASLTAIRDDLIPRAGQPSPCVMFKLMGVVTVLQKKIGIFKATLLAQHTTERLEVIKMFDDLDDASMALRLGMSPLFDKYSRTSDKSPREIILPSSFIPISQSLLEVEEIRRQQETLTAKLHKILFQDEPAPSDTIRDVLQYACDKMKELMSKLKAEQPRVKMAMVGANVNWQFSIYAQFYEALSEQRDMYSTLEGQLRQYANIMEDVPDMTQQVTSDMQDLDELIATQASIAMPTDIRPSTLPSPTYNPEYNSEYSSEFKAPSDSYYNAMPADSPYKNPYESFDPLNLTPPPPHGASKDSLEVIKDKMVSREILSPRSIYVLFNTSYGNVNSVSRNFKLSIVATKSLEQLLWEAAQANPLTRDAIVDYTVYSTLVDREKLHDVGKETIWRLNCFNHLHMHLTSLPEDMPEKVKLAVIRVLDFMKHKFYYQTSESSPQSFIGKSNMQIMMDVAPTMHAVDVFVMTGRETTTMQGLPLPPAARVFYPFNNAAHLPYTVAKKLTNNLMPGSCSVYKRNVRTNDGAIYRLSDRNIQEVSKCEILLAADCSPDKTFVITTSLTNHSLPSQAIRIVAAHHEIQLIPAFLAERVKVDGEDKVIRPGQPLVYFQRTTSGREAVSVIISRLPTAYIHVELPLIGLNIVFTNTLCSIDVRDARLALTPSTTTTVANTFTKLMLLLSRQNEQHSPFPTTTSNKACNVV